MTFATPDDFENVKTIFKTYEAVFPHIRTDYLMRRINDQQMVFEDGVVITIHIVKSRYKLGLAEYMKSGDCVLHQIAAQQTGNGQAAKILQKFFDEMQTNVFLSVRKDNLRANKFYQKMGMELIGDEHNTLIRWSNDTLPGNVYVKRLEPIGRLEM